MSINERIIKMSMKGLHKMRFGLRGLICLLLLIMTGSVVYAATPGGLEKKYVGLLFDVINTSPSNVLANIDKFEKNAPYLDGLALALYDVPVVKADGTVGKSEYTRIVHPTERWTRENLKSQIPVLKAIASRPNMKESFLLVWMTPKSKGTRLALTDDKAWANFAENMATMAWLAKESGLKGLMLDPEEYATAMQYIHTFPTGGQGFWCWLTMPTGNCWSVPRGAALPRPLPNPPLW